MTEEIIVHLTQNHAVGAEPQPLACDSDCACGINVGPIPPVAALPVFYSLELTPTCNNRCQGCYNVFAPNRQSRDGMIGHRQPLTFAEWQGILARIAPHARRLKLTGGEPTLSPDFARIVRRIQHLDLEFVLFTNGRWLQPDALLDLLSDVPQLVGMLISLHGARARSHEAFTGVPGSFSETVTNIKRAVDRGLPVTISTVLTQANADEIADIVALARELGTEHTVFNRFLGPPLPGISLSDAELVRATRRVDKLRQQGERVQFGVCIPQCLVDNSSTGCLAGTAYCTIDPWGNVRPCNHSALLAGNLLHQPLEEIWHSAVMEDFRNAIPAQCRTCTAFGQCHGGCRAVAMELGLDRDPLIRRPIPDRERPPTVLHLPSEARPLARYHLSQGLLVHGNAVLAVPMENRAVLSILDGQTTLQEIEQQFGQPGLALVGALYQNNMVELQTG